MRTVELNICFCLPTSGKLFIGRAAVFIINPALELPCFEDSVFPLLTCYQAVAIAVKCISLGRNDVAILRRELTTTASINGGPTYSSKLIVRS